MLPSSAYPKNTIFGKSELLKRTVIFLLAGLGLGLLAQRPVLAECAQLSQDDELARDLYEEAVIAEATGNLGGARGSYERLISQYPNSQFACWAGFRLANLKSGGARVNKEGRAQFIVGATLFGAWTGFALAQIAALGDEEVSESEGKALIWASIGGAAAGLIPSILVSPNLPMSTGRATLINFGWSWALWHGAGIAALPEDLSGQGVFGVSVGMSALGWGGTFALTHYLDVADGDAALVAASAYWSTWFSLAIGTLIGAEDFFDDRHVVIPVLLGGGDAGLVGGAFLSKYLNISSGRVSLISLGGLLGGLVGGGIVALAEPEDPRGIVAWIFGSSVAGLALAAVLTNDYDQPSPASAGLAALELTPQGWSLGVPPLRITPTSFAGRHGLAFEVPLLGGRF